MKKSLKSIFTITIITIILLLLFSACQNIEFNTSNINITSTDITSQNETVSENDTSKNENSKNNENGKNGKNNKNSKSGKSATSQKISRAVDKDRGLPVLMYHNFFDPSVGETGKDNNWFDISVFEEQIKYLADNDYYYPSWEEVYEFVNGDIYLPAKSVMLTIDDGRENNFRLAVPVLEKYDVTATLFVITSKKGVKRRIKNHASDNIKFYSHTHDMHRGGTDGKGRFLTVTQEQAMEDLTLSKNIVNSADVFCYPYGHYSDFTKEMLTKADFKLALTVESGRIFPGMDKLALPRVRMNKGDGLNAFINRVR